MPLGKESGYPIQPGRIAAFLKLITDLSCALPVSQHLFVFMKSTTFNNAF